MSLPPNYSGMPGKEQHNYFRDVCHDFQKVVKSTKDLEKLEMAMERFMNASREVEWPHHNSNSAVYHRDKAEKAAQRVLKTYRRYVENLESNSAQDLLNALAEMSSFIDQLKVR